MAKILELTLSFNYAAVAAVCVWLKVGCLAQIKVGFEKIKILSKHRHSRIFDTVKPRLMWAIADKNKIQEKWVNSIKKKKNFAARKIFYWKLLIQLKCDLFCSNGFWRGEHWKIMANQKLLGNVDASAIKLKIDWRLNRKRGDNEKEKYF